MAKGYQTYDKRTFWTYGPSMHLSRKYLLGKTFNLF